MTNCPLDITPLAQSSVQAPSTFSNLNYTSQDFWSLKTRLVGFINERFGVNGTVLPNTFNDFVESDPAIMLLENIAFIADLLSFKMDQNANEIFIDTVTEVENAFRLAKLVGFQPQPPIAASSMWIATINNSLLSDINISTPVTVDVSTGSGTTTIELFAADGNNNPLFGEDIVITAGSISNQSIIGLEGKTRTETFVGNGNISQTFNLSFTPVVFDSVIVIIDGITWNKVDYFTDSEPRQEYRVEFDSNYNGFLIFGNNRAGIIPSSGSQINVSYRIGGGIQGNIVTGFVSKQSMTSVPGLQFAIPVNFQNYTKGSNGYAGDGIEEIRRKLPLWLTTQNRAVSGKDYKIICDQFGTAYHGQIGKSTAVLRNYGCAGNVIDIYVLALDGTDGLAPASSDLKVDLTTELNIVKMLTDYVCIRDGVVISVDTTIDITLSKQYKNSELELTANINNIMAQFYSLNNWEYGKTLKDADVVKILASMKQIDDISVSFVTADPDNGGSMVVADFYEIIRSDQITLAFLYS